MLNNVIAAKETKIKKCDDELVDCKHHKHFLDVLAIQAGKKKRQAKKTHVKVEPVAEIGKHKTMK